MGFNIVEGFLGFTLLGAEWVLWLLLILSVWSVAIILDRLFYFIRIRINFSKFSSKLSKSLAKGDKKEALALCLSGKSLEEKVVSTGLTAEPSNKEFIEALMEEVIVREKQKMEQGLVILGTLGNNAPFIGLFGTVIGIIKAFHDLSMNPDGGPSVVMSGISEALVATAIGILVAIPAVIAFNFFNRVIRKRLANASSLVKTVSATSSLSMSQDKL